MNISQYATYFHDGDLIDIKHFDNKIELYLSSAEMDLEDLKDDILLGDYDRMKGILHLEGIKKITRSNQPFIGHLKMERQLGDILHLDIIDNVVKLVIRWEDFDPRNLNSDCSTIIIEAEEIYWENKPDLVDPYG